MSRGSRIYGGFARGRKIKIPKGIRPTRGIVKRSMFDTLGPLIQEAKILDLFAGSGGFGLEALSRGAREVWFVERSIRSLRAIKENLRLLQFAGRAITIHGDALKVLKNLKEQGEKFDIIFADPPYDYQRYKELIELAEQVLESEGILIVETRKGTEFSVPKNLEKKKEVTFGQTKISYYSHISG